MGGSIGHRCTVWGGLLDIGVLYGGGLLDIGVLYGGVYWTYVLYGGSIGHRCTVWGGSIGHMCCMGVYWT